MLQKNIAIGAKEIITETLSVIKREGIHETDVIDLHLRTKLPFNVINKVMTQLEREGKVRGEDIC